MPLDAHDEAKPRRPKWTREGLREVAQRVILRVAVASPQKLTQVLAEALEGLGNRLGVDRTTIFVTSGDRRGFRPIASWAVDGVPRSPMVEQREAVPRLIQDGLRGKTVRIPWVEAMDDSMAHDRASLRKLGMKSMLAIPLRVGGRSVGAVSFGGLRQRFSWPKSLERDLAPVADALALGLDRLAGHWELERVRVEHDETQRLAGIAHWRHNFALDTTQGSSQLYRLFGFDPRAEFKLSELLRKILPHDRDALARQISTLLGGQPAAAVECRTIGQRDPVQWLRCWGEIRSDAGGKPAFAHGILQDITDRKQSQLVLEDINRSLIQAQERERARLGREIHDDLGQRLVSLQRRIDGLARLHDGPGASIRRVEVEFAEARVQLEELMTTVRSLSHSLHPAHLRQVGLANSLRGLCRETSQFSEIDVVLEARTVPAKLDDEVVLALYRVAQEAVNNANKHAEARNVQVELLPLDGGLVLRVTDDGRGFDPDKADRRAGLGLLGMRERVRALGGWVEVRSAIGRGTVVEARVPLWTQSRADDP